MLKKLSLFQRFGIASTVWVTMLSIARLALAAPANFSEFVRSFVEIFNKVIIILIGFGVVYLLFSIAITVGRGDSEQARTQGRNTMLYGVIALFVIVSLWGLVNILLQTFFGGPPPIPPSTFP